MTYFKPLSHESNLARVPCEIVACGCNFLQYEPHVKGQQFLLLSKFFFKILSNIATLLHFTTMLKLSYGPQLYCCRVNSTLFWLFFSPWWPVKSYLTLDLIKVISLHTHLQSRKQITETKESNNHLMSFSELTRRGHVNYLPFADQVLSMTWIPLYSLWMICNIIYL